MHRFCIFYRVRLGSIIESSPQADLNQHKNRLRQVEHVNTDNFSLNAISTVKHITSQTDFPDFSFRSRTKSLSRCCSLCWFSVRHCLLGLKHFGRVLKTAPGSVQSWSFYRLHIRSEMLSGSFVFVSSWQWSSCRYHIQARSKRIWNQRTEKQKGVRPFLRANAHWR